MWIIIFWGYSIFYLTFSYNVISKHVLLLKKKPASSTTHLLDWL